MRARSAALIGALVLGLHAPLWAQTPAPTASRGIHLGPVRLGGYIQYDLLAGLGDEHQTIDDTFRFRRARLQLKGLLTKDIEWAASGEATTSTVLRDAYVVVKYLPAASVHIGQFVMPYGLERFVATSNRMEFTERVLRDLTPGRDLGVMVANDEPFFGWLSYGAAVANGTGQNVADDNSAKDIMGRLLVTPPRVPGLKLAVNLARGAQPAGMRRRQGADISYETRTYHLAAEFLRETIDGSVRTEQKGFYMLGSWRKYPQAPTRVLDHVEFGVRYGKLMGSTSAVHQLDFASNYYVRRNVRFMFDLIVPFDHPRQEPGAIVHVRTNVVF